MARRLSRLVVALVASATLSGCVLPGDGPNPDIGDIFFPTGLALNTNASRLYIANSDFDLQYNQGTIQAVNNAWAQYYFLPQYCETDVDCSAAGKELVCDNQERVDRTAPSHWCVPGGREPVPCWQMATVDNPTGEKSAGDRLLAPGRCSAIPLLSLGTEFLFLEHRPEGFSSQLNLIAAVAQTDAFASDLVFRPRPASLAEPGGPVLPGEGRLFATIRGNESLTFADVKWPLPESPLGPPAPNGDPQENLDCGQTGLVGKCSDDFARGEDKDEDRGQTPRFSDLPPEPSAMAMDRAGEVIVVSHQTQGSASLFINAWERGSVGGPRLQYVVGGLPNNAMDVAYVPESEYAVKTFQEARQEERPPGFLMTFRTTAEIYALRYFNDAGASPPRPFLSVSGKVPITANSGNFDSRGIAVDSGPRKRCEASCPVGGLERECLEVCAGVPLGVYIANRTPPSLLVGQTVPNRSITASDDLPEIYDSIPLSTGPSAVVIGDVLGPDGVTPLPRVFVVCFESRLVYVFDPELQRIETIIRTGRGPSPVTIGRTIDPNTRRTTPTGLGYIGMFTDSYIGVVDLNQKHRETYGTIIMTLGTPTPPRAAQ